MEKLETFVLCVATTGFTGFLPAKLTNGRLKWGGFMGALVGFVIQLAILKWAAYPLLWMCVAALFSFAIGSMYAGCAAEIMYERYGPRQRHNGEWTVYDYNEINIDEVHGQLLAAIPIAAFSLVGWRFWLLNVASFALFRWIDCKKIWPVSVAERLIKGPLSIMLDDTVGASMTAILVALLGAIVAVFPF